jgi:DNA-binding IclR family transcriptional regulator
MITKLKRHTEPTEKQLQTLEFIRAYSGKHGHSPTVREIAAALGVNVCSAHRRLECLERHGLLRRVKRHGYLSLEFTDGSDPRDQRRALEHLARVVADAIVQTPYTVRAAYKALLETEWRPDEVQAP